MQELRRDGENVTISASKDELSALGAALLEALEGGYAFPGDVWEELVGYPSRPRSARRRHARP